MTLRLVFLFLASTTAATGHTQSNSSDTTHSHFFSRFSDRSGNMMYKQHLENESIDTDSLIYSSQVKTAAAAGCCREVVKWWWSINMCRCEE
jgi:hypothetical protein